MPTPKSNLAVTLHRLPLFIDLSEEEFLLIADRVTLQEYQPGMIRR